MDQEIPSQFAAQPCCSICPLHFASVCISDLCLQLSGVDNCIGGWLTFLPLKVLRVQGHSLLRLALAAFYCSIVCFFFLSPLGLPIFNSVALGDQVPGYNKFPHFSPTCTPKQTNKQKLRFNIRIY